MKALVSHKMIWIVPFVVAFWTLTGSPAAADTTFDLTTGNSAISGFTGPYASVDVHLVNSTTATVTFTSLTSGGNIYLMGDGGTVALNVNASTFTATATGSNGGTGFTPGPYTPNVGAGQAEDGFGKFNFTVDSFDGFTHSSDTVVVTLTDTSGVWGNSNDVLTPNNGGSLAGAHIFVTSSPADASNGALATGFAANGSQLPEPTSLTLGLIGLFGLGFTRIRRLVRRFGMS